MCSPVKCRQCGKTTWAGCGNHVETVKRSVPAGQWCGGHAQSGSTGPSTIKASSGLFRIFGR